MARVDDPQLAAFRRLLTDAHRGGQAKVDALVALVQRTVFVVPWPSGIEGWRTLVNRDGVVALPLFTEASQLTNAGRRFGWLDPNGDVPHAEVGARAALNYALSQGLSFVVVDIASEHALEVARDEFAPLLSPAARRESSGPYAGAGKISSSLIRAVRPTPPPMRPGGTNTPPPGTLSPPRMPRTAPSETPRVSASTTFNPNATSFGGASTIAFKPLPGEPSEALLDALTDLLREYPEIEWASLCNASRGPAPAVPTIAVRVDASYRQRVNEIVAAVHSTGNAHGASLDVLLLDDAAVMRSARSQGIAFYPWRKK